MNTHGIRILDKTNGYISVKLQDILKEINHGELFNWSILFFDGIGHLNKGKSISDLSKEALHSKNGILLSWEELNSLANCFEQIFDILIIGSKNSTEIIRYKNDIDMYESCDIVVNMFDSSYWEVFSKDNNFIQKLSIKFKDVKNITDYSFLG